MAQITITKTIDQGDSITIQASPGENYSFGGWIFDPNQSPVNTNPYTYTPVSSDNIEAVFNITDPLVVVCSTSSSNTKGRYLYLVNNSDQVYKWSLSAGTNTYTGTQSGFELDNIKTFYGATYPDTPGGAFLDANAITSIDAHSLVNVEYIPREAFENQTSLTSITLPLYLRDIGPYYNGGNLYLDYCGKTFKGCTSLTTVNFGNDTTTVGKVSWIKTIYQNSFEGCTALTSLSIPTYPINSTDANSNDLVIYEEAFKNCTSLSSFTVNNIYGTHRVREIMKNAFQNCTSLTSFYLPNYGNSLQGFGTWYGSYIDAYGNPFSGCNKLTTFTQQNSSANIRVEGNCIINYSSGTLVSGNANMSIGHITSNNITVIGKSAFSGMCSDSTNSSNRTFTLPDYILVIKESAFSNNTTLTNFLTTSSSTLSTICASCFYGCSNLELVDLYSLTQFGQSADFAGEAYYVFYGCTKSGLIINIRTSTVPTIYGYGTGGRPSGAMFPSGKTFKIKVKPGLLSNYAATAGEWAYQYTEGNIYTFITTPTDVNPLGAGTVSGGGIAEVNSTSGISVSLTATNASGYTFNNWTRSGVSLSTSNPYTFTVQDNSNGYIGTTIANFTSTPSYTISASANPSGSGSITGTGSYLSGDSCTLSATPSTGYTFVNWTEGASEISSASTFTFTVSGNRTFVANFTSSYTISASPNPIGGGSISGAGTYTYGDSCTLTATSNTGYGFSNWTENGSVVSSNSSYTFTVSGNRTLVANYYTINPYTISASANPAAGGTVSGAGSYYPGDSCTLRATPATNYTFSNWTESGSAVSSSNPYTFTVNSNRTLVANFLPPGITIITNAADSVILKNKSNSTYTWNLVSGTNVYDGSVSGFALDNLKSIYRFTSSSHSTNNKITSIDISKTSITEIPSYAFYYHTKLSTVKFPSTLTSIDEYAFDSCNLSSSGFTIPSSVNFVGYKAFSGNPWQNGMNVYYKDNICFGYNANNTSTSYTITSGTRLIASKAFENNTRITTVNLPASITSINSYAFDGCNKVSTFKCLATTPPTLGINALGTIGSSTTLSIKVPSASVNTYKSASGWRSYSDYIKGI